MANLSTSANLRFILDGSEINAPIEWQDIEIIADFQNDSIQANITTDTFTFVNEARAQILAYIESGKNGGFGIFEGLPFQIQAYSATESLVVFDGFLDFRDGFIDFPDIQRLEVSISQKQSLSALEKRIEGITYAFLKEKGIITPSDYTDVRYVVIKPNQAIDIVIASIVLYLMVKELRQQIRELSRDIASIASAGVIGKVIFAIAALIFEIAYTVAIAIAIARLVATLVNALYPIRRTHKAMTLKKLIEKACEYAGYNFSTSIAELDNYTYLPSNLSVDVTGADAVLIRQGTIKDGIPNSTDYGYLLTEMLSFCKSLFKAKYAIVDGTLQLHWEGAQYWLQTANYTLPDVLIEQYRYNVEELKANTILCFDTDIIDEWTIENYTGTNYEVILSPIVTRPDKETNLVSGLNQVRFPVALGNRKDTNTVLEDLIDSVNNFARSIGNIFRQRINLSNVVPTNGVLKVSSNNHSKPKLLYIGRNGLPTNHRELLSAKYLYRNFHYYDSFAPPFLGQKRVYEGVQVPFGLSDFVKLVRNSYFRDASGAFCKATKVAWRLGADKATFDFWTREIYTRNIQQTEIEP